MPRQTSHLTSVNESRSPRPLARSQNMPNPGSAARRQCHRLTGNPAARAGQHSRLSDRRRGDRPGRLRAGAGKRADHGGFRARRGDAAVPDRAGIATAPAMDPARHDSRAWPRPARANRGRDRPAGASGRHCLERFYRARRRAGALLHRDRAADARRPETAQHHRRARRLRRVAVPGHDVHSARRAGAAFRAWHAVVAGAPSAQRGGDAMEAPWCEG